MASIHFQSNSLHNSMKTEPQLDTQSLPTTKLYCSTHSTLSKKQPILFINVNYFEPNLRKKTKIDFPFLCQLCLSKIKAKKSFQQNLKYIKSLQQFQNQYINSVFKKYSTFKQPQQFLNKMQLLQQAQNLFTLEIDKIIASYNQAFNNYKRTFSGIFSAFIQPFNRQKIELFRKGMFNQQSIKQFYINSQRIQSFSSLIGEKNQQVIKKISQGLKQSFDAMSKQIKKQLYSSQNLLKSIIQVYIHEQLFKKFKNLDTNPIYQGNILQKIKTIKEERKKQNSKNKASLSQNTQNNSLQQNQDKTNLNLTEERFSNSSKKPLRKHKYIRKQRLEKPSRCNDVHVIAEDYLFRENVVVVLYIVNKTYTERVESEKVNQIPREEFKRKYPESYKVYQQEMLKKRNRS